MRAPPQGYVYVSGMDTDPTGTAGSLGVDGRRHAWEAVDGEPAAGLDPVTGLDGPVGLVDWLDGAFTRAADAGTVLGALVVGLDDAAPSDRVAADVAEAIGGAVRDSDGAARVGPDEFVVVLEGASGEDDLDEVVDRVAARVRGVAAASVGFAAARAGDGTLSLLDRAGRAMLADRQFRSR